MMPIANFRFSLEVPTANQIGNRQLAIANYLWTRRRGQGAECPDRFITKKRLIARRFFFGITPRLNTLLT
jgi:hypothetical protein